MAVLAALGIVLVLLPGASVRDVAAGAVLLTAAALALQATVSLLVWRLIAIRGDRSGWMRRAIDRPPGARRRGRHGRAGSGGHLGLRAARRAAQPPRERARASHGHGDEPLVRVLQPARRVCGAPFALPRRHRLFASLVVLSAAIRALVWVAYQPGFFFFGDSFTYLGNSVGLRPNPIRPIGYPMFLHVLLLGHDIAVVTAGEQLVGVITAGICYALFRRFGAGPVLASAAAAPVLFDGYLIDIAQYIVAESLFMLLVMGALALLVWRSRPSPAACAAAGALLGAAALTRTVGMVLLLPALLYIVVRWVGALRIVLGWSTCCRSSATPPGSTRPGASSP